jgi:hypothetical protein
MGTARTRVSRRVRLYGNSPSGLFQFKLNNVYNGTPLNTAAAITGLANNGVMRRTDGAVPTVAY